MLERRRAGFMNLTIKQSSSLNTKTAPAHVFTALVFPAERPSTRNRHDDLESVACAAHLWADV